MSIEAIQHAALEMNIAVEIVELRRHHKLILPLMDLSYLVENLQL